MNTLLLRFRSSKSGASAAEYALIISLIGLVIIAGATLLGNSINNNFSTAAVKITNAAP